MSQPARKPGRPGYLTGVATAHPVPAPEAPEAIARRELEAARQALAAARAVLASVEHLLAAAAQPLPAPLPVDPDPRWATVSATARHYAVSRETVRGWLVAAPPTVRVLVRGGVRRVALADLDRWLAGERG